jgi:hypothetical protein
MTKNINNVQRREAKIKNANEFFVDAFVCICKNEYTHICDGNNGLVKIENTDPPPSNRNVLSSNPVGYKKKEKIRRECCL